MHSIEVKMQAFVFDAAELETVLEALDHCGALPLGKANLLAERAQGLADTIRGACR